MFVMLKKWLGLLRQSESFTQLTEQILEVLKNRLAENKMNADELRVPAENSSAPNNLSNVQYVDFKVLEEKRAAA